MEIHHRRNNNKADHKTNNKQVHISLLLTDFQFQLLGLSCLHLFQHFIMTFEKHFMAYAKLASRVNKSLTLAYRNCICCYSM